MPGTDPLLATPPALGPAAVPTPLSAPPAAPLSAMVHREFACARLLLDEFVSNPANLERVGPVAQTLADALRSGHKVLACGNGGSACDAMHFCEEFTGRYRSNRPALAAAACIDPGHLTCTANDFGYDEVFARWIEGLARPGDVLVALSTSGNSENIIRALRAGRARGMATVALLGRDGGAAAGLADHEWLVPGHVVHAGQPLRLFADRIQEVHKLLLHVLIAAVESLLAPAGDWSGFERDLAAAIQPPAPAPAR